MTITQHPSWQALQQHYDGLRPQIEQSDWYEQHLALQLHQQEIHLDASRHLVTEHTMHLLYELAEASQLQEHIHALFAGDLVNTTEQRPALHSALRTLHRADPAIASLVHDLHQQMQLISEKLRTRRWYGFSNLPITDVVNIGIGGSHLGPLLAHEALSAYQGPIRCHFISSIDGTQLHEVLRLCNPATTLFIIASKTFTTQETLLNAEFARTWLQQHAGTSTSLSAHFIAVTAAPEKAQQFGIAKENILVFWDWVGGRYSLCSAVGLSVAIGIGMKAFRELLAGAASMDRHFHETPIAQNIPITLALLSIWYTNFFHRQTLAIIPYSYPLRNLPAYLQQLVMESNGKGMTITDECVDYATSEIIWGGMGTDSQHAFHQLLHQGSNWCPVDFILPKTSDMTDAHRQAILSANCMAQADALFYGRNAKQLSAAGYTDSQLWHRLLPGHRPSNLITFEKLTPRTFGALIALYEHKTYTQSVIWQINAFDQFGVEWGKELAKELLATR